ncbi:MAG: hypothetical protein HYZ53_11500 [Planctomycetes bacterium]|nr:hypothetical protein [Planctomycetota bacterium]
MFVTVHLKKAFAKDWLRQRPGLPGTLELGAVLTDLGLALEPLHPGSTVEDLAAHFSIAAPTEEVGREVVRRLNQLDAVEGAYLKPLDAPPSV